MKQQDSNCQYIIHSQANPYNHPYYQNSNFSQNLLLHNSYFPGAYPYHYYPSWPPQPIYSDCYSILYPFQGHQISEQVQQNTSNILNNPDELQNQKNNFTKTRSVIQDQQEYSSSQNKRILRKINRIKHITQVNKNKAKKKGKKSSTSYYWSYQQNGKYFDFLRANPGLFDLSVSEKKNLKVNVMMSKRVKTRSPQQCHSHHQKMIKRFGSVAKIIEQTTRQALKNIEIKKVELDQVKDQVKVEDRNIDL